MQTITWRKVRDNYILCKDGVYFALTDKQISELGKCLEEIDMAKAKSDADKLALVLADIGVPYSVDEMGGYTDIIITANASDKYVIITFEHGKFAYSN